MDRVVLPLLLLLLVAACEVEGRVRGRARRVAGAEQRLVPAWPGPYWEIPGQFCSAHNPRLQCCLDRDDRWVMGHMVTVTWSHGHSHMVTVTWSAHD